jgi:hypothetical protein
MISGAKLFLAEKNYLAMCECGAMIGLYHLPTMGDRLYCYCPYNTVAVFDRWGNIVKIYDD